MFFKIQYYRSAQVFTYSNKKSQRSFRFENRKALLTGLPLHLIHKNKNENAGRNEKKPRKKLIFSCAVFFQNIFFSKKIKTFSKKI